MSPFENLKIDSRLVKYKMRLDRIQAECNYSKDTPDLATQRHCIRKSARCFNKPIRAAVYNDKAFIKC